VSGPSRAGRLLTGGALLVYLTLIAIPLAVAFGALLWWKGQVLAGAVALPFLLAYALLGWWGIGVMVGGAAVWLWLGTTTDRRQARRQRQEREARAAVRAALPTGTTRQMPRDGFTLPNGRFVPNTGRNAPFGPSRAGTENGS
jgi:hypothetical protein